MVNIDRFLVGSILSMAAVTFYTTPYEVVTKILIIPSALSAVIFPAFSATFIKNEEKALKIFEKSVKYLFIILFPIIFITTIFASEGLGFWLGKDFINQSSKVSQVLLIGILLNGMAHIPFTLIQAAGRPDLTAKFHLIELPVFLFLVWYLTKNFGIIGTSTAWTIRVLIDCFLLFGVSTLFLPFKVKIFILNSLKVLILALVFLIIPLFGLKFIPKSIYFIVVTSCFSVFSWQFFLNQEDRLFLKQMVRNFLVNKNPIVNTTSK